MIDITDPQPPKRERDRERQIKSEKEKRNQTGERGGRANENIRMVQGKGNDVMGRQKCAELGFPPIHASGRSGISLGEPEPSQSEMDQARTPLQLLLRSTTEYLNQVDWFPYACPM